MYMYVYNQRIVVRCVNVYLHSAYVNIHACMHTYMHTYMHADTYINNTTYLPLIHSERHIHVHMRMCIYTHPVYLYIYTHPVYLCIYTHTCNIHTYIHIYIHTCMHTFGSLSHNHPHIRIYITYIHEHSHTYCSLATSPKLT